MEREMRIGARGGVDGWLPVLLQRSPLLGRTEGSWTAAQAVWNPSSPD